MHFTSFILPVSLVVGALATPVPSPLEAFKRAGPAAGQVITKCSSSGMLALAFDDGPYQYTQTLVNTLNAAGAKATFFVTGTLYGCIHNQAAAVKAAYNSGHQIASHSWSHPSNFGSLSTADLTTQMQRLEGALRTIIGKKPTYMRPPYLATGGNVLSTMRTLGYRVITDDVDSGDWNGLSAAQSQARFTQAGAGGQGHIPLMHEVYASTVNTLVPWLINWAKQNNLRLVTVAECLGDAGGAYTTPTVAATSSC
ncbi:Probable peptidoglycan-N-acetylglucosamine deacetylase ARB_03699 {ECO:0000305} Short=Peptidoglycan GlcNAc deacetylase {ECO:0000250/UniProtKB:Q8DP63}; {ECO:0000250/UniProtKB:Q8DP63}; AltName: Full=Peptidoglycan N-deacetylase {ECO:0000250/UniProtKB:Q8DP63}; Short=PG N-deacetylase {ECO:0000250/UniProtKB:Q8DP63}; Flags: Precursor [Serendipita indica DSM 11827]|nr:Probable peptidoglycan-N-acetylglucosamine deacetylase ARB_03699 {ECO:0000305} Short=Peptidoglycan GlcNAc deacetylase {ECO:0000250/UniProtKB:Q8DP63}; {ECO:0000250/UniProtKB:Q8DP63}; AltName: Full=Peptidoglycan N-deacetylase {ECO:0000250/UniProtKB:Q8DP63}; Short=PG N-deacetylase {ECO:0000250/UniProtKB:Q8DP63}; Flags: Precursor [Serendipita indica DSM 11827]